MLSLGKKWFRFRRWEGLRVEETFQLRSFCCARPQPQALTLSALLERSVLPLCLSSAQVPPPP